MKKNILIILLLFYAPSIFSQVNSSTELYKTIKKKDSLLFNIGFNTCDINQFETLVSSNFEFYHDIAGITNTKQAFVSMIRDGLCKMSYKAIRRLDEKTLQIYALKKNGEIYGAIEKGVHRFYALEENKPEYFTSVAQFTNVWLLENGKWKLSRSLSFDHKEIDY